MDIYSIKKASSFLSSHILMRIKILEASSNIYYLNIQHMSQNTFCKIYITAMLLIFLLFFS